MADPASIRTWNPGAMWPGPSSKKFGSTGFQRLRDGNLIAKFDNPVNGAAAQFDLLNRSYTGMPLRAAIRKWSGNNSPAEYAARISRETGIGLDDPLTPEALKNPKIGIPLARSAASWEAGRPYPMTDEQWGQAHSMAFGAPMALGASPPSLPTPPSPASPPSTVSPPATPAPPSLPFSGLAKKISRPFQGGSLPFSNLFQPQGSSVQPRFMSPSESGYYRDLAAKLTMQASNTAPVGSWTQALARGIQGAIAGRLSHRVFDDQAAQEADAEKTLGGYLDGGSAAAAPAMGMASGVPKAPSKPLTAPVEPVQRSDIGEAGTEEVAPPEDTLPSYGFGLTKALPQQSFAPLPDESNYHIPLPAEVQATLPNGGLTAPVPAPNGGMASGVPTTSARRAAIKAMLANPMTRSFGEQEAAKEIAADRQEPITSARAQYYASRSKYWQDKQAQDAAKKAAVEEQFDGAGLDEDGNFVPATPKGIRPPSHLGGPTDDQIDPQNDGQNDFADDLASDTQDITDAGRINPAPRNAGYINSGTVVADNDTPRRSSRSVRESEDDNNTYGVTRPDQPLATPSDRAALRGNPRVVKGATPEQQQRLKDEMAHRAQLNMLYGEAPKGSRWDDDGSLIDLKDQSKKEIAAARAGPMLKDINVAKAILVDGRTSMVGRAAAKGNLGAGIPLIGDAVAGVSKLAANYMEPATVEAIQNLDHTVATLTALVEGNRHANAQDVRFLKFFSIEPTDTPEIIGNKLDQLNSIYNSYVGNSKEAQKGHLYESQALKRANEIRAEQGLPPIGEKGSQNESERVKGLSNEDLLKELQR